MRQGNKDAVVSARLYPKIKEKLIKSGYTPADAINWFVHTYYEENPKQKIKIKKDMLELKLHSLKKEECDIQVEISAVERQLESLAATDLSDIEEIPVIDEELEEEKYPLEVMEALELVQNAFDTKRDLLVSPKIDIADSVDSFIVMHGDVVQNAFKMCKGIKWKEFREILISEIE